MRALITGGAKRLGAAMARHLAQQGWKVAIHFHTSESEALALAKEIGGVALQGDLTNREVLKDLIGQARDALGGELTLLINNASRFDFDRIDDKVQDAGFEIWDANLKTNLEAPFFLSQAFANQCTSQGNIINMIDQRVLRLTPNYASYTLAKSALHTMTVTAAQALGPRIRVNAIGPGTTLQGANQPDENFNHHRRISVLQKGADEQDILGALDYLLSADKVTGQMIAVDGGQHLIWELPK